MKQAKAADVHVVDEGFLDDVGTSPASVPQLIVQHSIADWGSDVSSHLMNIYVLNLTVYGVVWYHPPAPEHLSFQAISGTKPEIGWKECIRSDPFCVEWGVTP